MVSFRGLVENLGGESQKVFGYAWSLGHFMHLAFVGCWNLGRTWETVTVFVTSSQAGVLQKQRTLSFLECCPLLLKRLFLANLKCNSNAT